MASAQDYVDLAARQERLMRDHAVLLSKEEEKGKRRAELLELLKAKGVDTSKPLSEERARLEKEADEILAQARAKIDEFEKGLKQALPPSNPVPLEKLNPTKPIPLPEGMNILGPSDTDDIDIG